MRLFVLNDEPVKKRGTIRCGVVNEMGEWLVETKYSVDVEASGSLVVPVTIVMPTRSGDFTVRVELYELDVPVSVSEKRVHVIEQTEIPPQLRNARLALLDKKNELHEFVEKLGLNGVSLSDVDLRECDALIVSAGEVRTASYQVRLGAISKFLEAGKTVVVLEPEFEIEETEVLSVALGVDLRIEKREDLDKGGYDSYVFADDLAHPLWRGISQEYLKMFNGGYGGEVVSQHNVTPTIEHKVLARCGLYLGVIAVCEIPVGKGKVIISRLQSRGRLVKSAEPDSLYSRRVDPIMRNYVVNLLAYACRSLAHD